MYIESRALKSSGVGSGSRSVNPTLRCRRGGVVVWACAFSLSLEEREFRDSLADGFDL